MKRVDSLDHLRGFMAIGIMLYHFLKWTYGPYESETFLGVIGIYGVSTFYVLSGLTLFLVYEQKLSKSNLLGFFTKRVFRILPLLWLSILLNILLLNVEVGTYKLAINLTGLFGFIDHDNYITTGSWSIGNELVFYTLFPFILIAHNKSKYAVELFTIAITIISVGFSFLYLNGNETLSNQWSNYINPINQAVFFVSGIWLGKTFKNYQPNYWSTVAFFFCVLFVIFNPFKGDLITIVSGWPRVLFSIITVIFTYSFFKQNLKFPNWVNRLFSFFGAISYSVYLLHAIVFWMIAKYINRLQEPALFFTLVVIATVVFSALSYYSLEKFFMHWGKKLANRFNK